MPTQQRHPGGGQGRPVPSPGRQRPDRKRLCRAALVSLLWTALACSRSETTPRLQWHLLAQGFEYARANRAVQADEPAITVHWLRLDPSKVTLEVVQAPTDLAKPLGDAVAFRRKVGGLAAINGGYFDPQWRPLGLLVSQGKELSKLRKVDHGVFALAGNRASVQHAKAWQPPEGLEFAVECGPRLLVDGLPLTFRPGLARRVALGIDKEGRVVIGVTEGVLTLKAWAELLEMSADHGGPALLQALTLAGGSSTMLDVVAGGLTASVRSAVQVPVGIAVVARTAIAPIAAAPTPSQN